MVVTFDRVTFHNLYEIKNFGVSRYMCSTDGILITIWKCETDEIEDRVTLGTLSVRKLCKISGMRYEETAEAARFWAEAIGELFGHCFNSDQQLYAFTDKFVGECIACFAKERDGAKIHRPRGDIPPYMQN